MVCFGMVRDGLDNVLSANGDWLEVPADLALVLHRCGGQAELARSAVHTGGLLLPIEHLSIGGGVELVLVSLCSQHGE